MTTGPSDDVGGWPYGRRMGRILFDTATSINGWIADEENSLAWLFAVEGGDDPDDGLFPSGATVLVEGSTTYEWILAEQDILRHPEKWQEFHGQKTTFVFTTRRLPVPEGADVRFVTGPVGDALPEIRRAAGDGDIWVVGGGDLAGQFLDADALDEIALSIAPVALTGGAPLFPRRLEADRLRLVSAEAVGPFARVVYAVRPPEGSLA
jgi:dihydrofolate reductase